MPTVENCKRIKQGNSRPHTGQPTQTAGPGRPVPELPSAYGATRAELDNLAIASGTPVRIRGNLWRCDIWYHVKPGKRCGWVCSQTRAIPAPEAGLPRTRSSRCAPAGMRFSVNRGCCPYRLDRLVFNSNHGRAGGLDQINGIVIELPATFRLADAIALQPLTFRPAFSPAFLLFPCDGALLVGDLALRVTFLVSVTMPGVEEPMYPLTLCGAPAFSRIGSAVVESDNVSA